MFTSPIAGIAIIVVLLVTYFGRDKIKPMLKGKAEDKPAATDESSKESTEEPLEDEA